jgi:prevent-host-death family protein
MLNSSIQQIPARNLQKSYKSLIEGVASTGKPLVLIIKNKPQAVLVSYEDYRELSAIKSNTGTAKLLEYAKEATARLKHLPPDLRENMDDILYDNYGK